MVTLAEQTETKDTVLTTRVKAIFLHGPRGWAKTDAAPIPMIPVEMVEAVTAKGLRGDTRFFTATRRGGGENLRQVSLIDEGTMSRHDARFGRVPWELVKSQIFLVGDLHLPQFLGRQVVFGDGDEAAIMELTINRQPCEAMDIIVPGLRAAMQNGEHGVLARVVRGGTIAAGQIVTIR